MKPAFAFGIALALTVPACSGGAGEAEGEVEASDPISEVEAEPATTATATADPSEFGIDPQPVRIGLDGPDFDACGGFGVITGLNPDDDNFLSVRAAPNTRAEELDKITTDTGVWLCDSDTGWIGVVYEAAGREDADCGVGSPVSSVRSYAGSCRSGWVSERYVQLIAG